MPVTSFDYYCFLTVVFFAFWMSRSHRFAPLVLIPVASGIDYLLGGAIARNTGAGVRRALVSASIFLNLGLILFCRYSGLPGLVLPLSLSFYAFQALTYTIDIYRGDSKPAPGYLQYAASVSFFPTILAGPITRVSSLAAQWPWKGATLTGEEGSRALFLIGMGVAKKFLIAYYLGNNLINRVFDHRRRNTASEG